MILTGPQDPPVNRDPSSVYFVYGILDLEIKNVITCSYIYMDGVAVWLWHLLVMFVYIAHHFIMLWLNPFGPRVDRKEWWFDYSVS